VNTQGRFLDDGKGRLVAPNDEADWVRAIDGESISQLESDVEVAAKRCGRRIGPSPPTNGLPAFLGRGTQRPTGVG